MGQLPAGTYSVRVANSQITDGKDGKPPQLSIWFEEGDGGEGRAWYSSLGFLSDGGFSEKAAKFAFDALRNLGWDVEERGYRFEELNGPTSPIIGRECEIVIMDEVYQGQTHTKVKWINDPNRPRGGGERMEPDAAKSFADRLRGALGKSAPAGRPRPVTAPRSMPPINKPYSADDQDVPF